MKIHKHRGVGLKRARSELLLEHVVYNMRRLVHLVEAESSDPVHYFLQKRKSDLLGLLFCCGMKMRPNARGIRTRIIR